MKPMMKEPEQGETITGENAEKINNLNNETQEVQKIASLKETSQAYEPPKTKNIADLEVVNVDMSLEDREGQDKEGKTFKYKVMIKDDEEYRVPGVVLGDLKEILKIKPDLKTIKVTKKGEGLGTTYTVIPLD